MADIVGIDAVDRVCGEPDLKGLGDALSEFLEVVSSSLSELLSGLMRRLLGVLVIDLRFRASWSIIKFLVEFLGCTTFLMSSS